MSNNRMYLGPMVLAAGALAFSTHVQAQSVSGLTSTQQVVINANVPQACTIALAAPTSGATFSGGTATITLGNTSATTSIGLVSITEQCNDKNGYTISIKDTNTPAATLTGSGGNTDTLTYSIVYDATGTPVTATPTNGNVVIFTAPKKATTTKQVTASITNPGNSTADTYTDTLVFTMTTK